MNLHKAQTQLLQKRREDDAARKRKEFYTRQRTKPVDTGAEDQRRADSRPGTEQSDLLSGTRPADTEALSGVSTIRPEGGEPAPELVLRAESPEGHDAGDGIDGGRGATNNRGKTRRKRSR